MAIPPEKSERIIRQAARVAELLAKLPDAATRGEFLRELVTEHEGVVWAVWVDDDLPMDSTMIIIKGKPRLDRVVTSGQGERVIAVPCESLEQAELMESLWGDGPIEEWEPFKARSPRPRRPRRRAR